MKFAIIDTSISSALSIHSKVEQFITLLEILKLKNGSDYVYFKASDSSHREIEFQLVHSDSKYKDIK